MAAAATDMLTTPHLLLRGAAPVTLDGLVFLGVGEATLDRNLIFTAQRGMAARVIHAVYGDVEAINGVYIESRRGAEKEGEKEGEKEDGKEDGKERDDADAKEDETQGEGSDVGKGGDGCKGSTSTHGTHSGTVSGTISDDTRGPTDSPPEGDLLYSQSLPSLTVAHVLGESYTMYSSNVQCILCTRVMFSVQCSDAHIHRENDILHRHAKT